MQLRMLSIARSAYAVSVRAKASDMGLRSMQIRSNTTINESDARRVARHGGYRQWEFVYFISTGVHKRERVTYVERKEYVSRSMERTIILL